MSNRYLVAAGAEDDWRIWPNTNETGPVSVFHEGTWTSGEKWPKIGKGGTDAKMQISAQGIIGIGIKGYGKRMDVRAR
jgi:hypothetical protein